MGKLRNLVLVTAFLIWPLQAWPESHIAYSDGNDTSTCGLNGEGVFDHYLPLFLGKWRMEHLAGVLTAGGMVLPFGAAGDFELVELEYDPELEVLFLSHPDAPEAMVLSNSMNMSDDELARLHRSEISLPESKLTPGDISEMAGCDIFDLPILYGKFHMTVEGRPMQFYWRLFIINADVMLANQYFGAVSDGYIIVGRRTVRLTREGEAATILPDLDYRDVPRHQQADRSPFVKPWPPTIRALFGY